METKTNTQATTERARLVARYKHLGRLLANELESDVSAIRRERDQVQAAIVAIDQAVA